ncbi:SDR family oxidoreductase [Sphingomonas psychrotolerans]|uniref:SDR family oxidoreductase n=1 Tax=Sphingomonas psychrotolerans TaxID=1327635 RepID=A0ABU3N728_9SPHN|nr:SDR family oxidoreductase [Sphingomonas psychrotolerans]MDT8760193.1 SDR family oxidoreductase [Sphingomonas psychrotolerans]
MSILAGRAVVITGASSGIGEACARAFAAKGAKIVLAARRVERLQVLVKALEAAGSEAVGVETDVTDEIAVERLFDCALARFGRVDVLVNNAGIADSTPADQAELALWRRVIDTNLTSAFLCARAAIRIMKPQGHGRIINVGSISARVPRANSPAYTASKWGLDGLTRSLAIDCRAHNIAVSIFHPGIVATELGGGMSSLPDDLVATPEDAADVVAHMADLPDHLNFYEALVVQNKIPFLGRG